MKSDIHPTYYPNATVTCACGNSFTVGSTMEKIEVEICSACHPFYTGQGKILDTAGRVEKFKARRATAELRKGDLAKSREKKEAKKAKKTESKKTKAPAPKKQKTKAKTKTAK
ncbi:MAG: 50S ribosomal protein L31 [Parcubacteria group bacterium]|nr:50S ribosomal protein L31 [Parcubacteria group bacterium]